MSDSVCQREGTKTHRLTQSIAGVVLLTEADHLWNCGQLQGKFEFIQIRNKLTHLWYIDGPCMSLPILFGVKQFKSLFL